MTGREALTHPWLTVRVQIALGAIFIAAALPKIADPPSFAHMIFNYRLVPGSLVNLSALILPWVELLCGLALVLGIWTRPARNLVALLLIVFIVAIGINLFRGNAIDCGCFNVADAGKTYAQRINDMRVDILRDLGMLLLAAQLWWADRTRALPANS
ncbi:MAG TPA: MauE/DoxX family redox-associated membrane protein [Thermoanaerobaculia bacterium]|nr:MauE/DoxX family redox-associated membrane protein [Thermoanaerobaculia bacterium]